MKAKMTKRDLKADQTPVSSAAVATPQAPAPVPSPYNPKQIWLESMREKIRDAYRKSWATLPPCLSVSYLARMPLRNTEPWPAQKNGYVDLTDMFLQHMDQWSELSLADADAHVLPMRDISQDNPFYVQAKNLGLPLHDTLADAIERDEDLADLIHDHPALMLMEPTAQDAVARWTYGAWHGRDPAIKKAAKVLLNIIHGAKAGRPPLFKSKEAVIFL